MDCSNLDANKDTEGFNLDCGKTWIYPKNLPIRDYQFNIVKEALFKNTLVCLPTGLGKTFIAAVIMYNYYRWYPQGKIIFMAPTKPLVGQQIDACFNITAIPKESTAELTGLTAQVNRSEEWTQKRVFFITPQVLQNDISKITELGKDIKCLVFDEAHRARGNYAYCEIIRQLTPINKNFRVLALSATPGSTIMELIKVCRELLIAHLEIRTEQSPDVSQYVFKRSLETVLIPLGPKLTEVREKYIRILDKHMRPLVKHNIINMSYNKLTKGRIFYLFQEHKNRQQRGPADNEIGKCLSVAVQLYHAFDLLIRHGLRGFSNYFQDLSHPQLKYDNELKSLVEEIIEYLGPTPCIDKLPDGSFPQIPEKTVFGHPKLYKLESILTDHFQKNTESRAIVFCEFVDTVIEAYTILLKQQPLVKPSMFMGQSNIAQKKQIQILEAFRKGLSNVLVSTCIGEEGLDIGEVDLVVCFDVNNKSTVRMVQRMGRTGRKREGRVVVLVTEGKEHSMLQECLQQKNAMTDNILHSKNLQNELYAENPKMVPDYIKPTPDLMYITVTKTSPKKKKLKNNTLNSYFKQIHENIPSPDIKIAEFNDQIPKSNFYFTKERPLDSLKRNNFFNKKIEKQRTLQSLFGQIGSSSDSKLFVSLLSFADARRFNIPLTQTENIFDKCKKQGDIRTMFLKQTLLSQPTPQKPTNTNDSDFNKEVLQELNTEISNVMYTSGVINENCRFCKHLFTCNLFSNYSDVNISKSWIPPSLEIIECLTEENMDIFLNNSCNNLLDSSVFDNDEYDNLMAQMDFCEEKMKKSSETAPTLHKLLLSPPINSSLSYSVGKMDHSEEKLKNTKLNQKTIETSPNLCKILFSSPDKASLNDSVANCSEEKLKKPKLSQKASEPCPNLLSTLSFSTPPKSSLSFSKNYVDIDTLPEDISTKYSNTKLDLGDKSIVDLTLSPKHKIPNKKNDFFKSAENKSKDFSLREELNDFVDDDLIFECFGKDTNKAEISQTLHESVQIKDIKKYSQKFLNKTEEVNRSALNEFIDDDLLLETFGETIGNKSSQKNQELDLCSMQIKKARYSPGTDKNVSTSQKSNSMEEENLDNKNKYSDTLKFFGLNSISDLFEEGSVDFENTILENQGTPVKNSIVASELAESPILASFEKSIHGRRRSQRQLNLKASFFSSTQINNDVNNYKFVEDNITTINVGISENIKDTVPTNLQNETSNKKVFRNEDIFDDSLLTLIDSKSPETKAQPAACISPDLFDSDSITYSPACDVIEIDSSPEISPVLSRKERKKVSLSDPNNKLHETQSRNKILTQAKNLCNEINLNINKSDSSIAENRFNLNINDICDNSILDILHGTINGKAVQKNEEAKDSPSTKNLSLEDIFDGSILNHFANNSADKTSINDYLAQGSPSSSKDKPNDASVLNNFADNTPEKYNINDHLMQASSSLNKKKHNDDSINDILNKYLDENKSKKSITKTQNKFALKGLKLKDVSQNSSTNIKNSSTYSNTSYLTNSNESLERSCSQLKLLNESLTCDYDSGEEFETSCTRLPVKKKPKISQSEQKAPAKSKSKQCDFLDLEAEVSSDAEVSDDEPIPSQDVFERSFVNDETQNLEDTRMQLQYLKSTRSPLLGRGKFKIPHLAPKINKSIFSQTADHDPNETYLNDSFCVESENMDLTEMDLSELEIAELRLKEMKKSKKRKTSPSSGGNKKKRRIIMISDDSD